MAAGLDPDYIQELFAAFGMVAVRRMFGGAGIFCDGMMIGLVSDGIIYLKTDDQGSAAFEREGCGPFAYDTRKGERKVMAYWRLPERLYDDPDELAQWARAAFAVAQVKLASKRPAAIRATPKAAARPKPKGSSKPGKR